MLHWDKISGMPPFSLIVSCNCLFRGNKSVKMVMTSLFIPLNKSEIVDGIGVRSVSETLDSPWIGMYLCNRPRKSIISSESLLILPTRSSASCDAYVEESGSLAVSRQVSKMSRCNLMDEAISWSSTISTEFGFAKTRETETSSSVIVGRKYFNLRPSSSNLDSSCIMPSANLMRTNRASDLKVFSEVFVSNLGIANAFHNSHSEITANIRFKSWYLSWADLHWKELH